MKQKKPFTPEEMISMLRAFRNYIGKTHSMSPQTRCETFIQTAKKERRDHENHLKSPTERKQQTFEYEGVEGKIDSLATQIKILQSKQELLENQHYQLRKSVRKLHIDKKHQFQERSQMIKKLDQMIDIQLKQEDNLNQFKQLFASRNLIN